MGVPPERGGDGAKKHSTPGGLPNTSITTQTEKDCEYWEFIRHRRLLVRVHPKSRSSLFDPTSRKTIPLPVHRLGNARTTLMVTKDGIDFRQDHWRRNRSSTSGDVWEGKTYFRVYGPYEVDQFAVYSEVGSSARGTRAVDLWLLRKSSGA